MIVRPAASHLPVIEAAQQFPASLKIAIPPQGFGRQLDRMTAWLDANCGAGDWTMTPAGSRGVVNDALTISFPDEARARAFVDRWCIGYRAKSI